MSYSVLVDAAILLHLWFMLFAVFGGLWVPRWPALAWGHVPSLSWIAINQFLDWPCPLTKLEQWLRAQGGLPNYHETFLSHYVLPLLGGVETREQNILGGILLIVGNGWLYGWIWRQQRRAAQHGSLSST